VGSEPQVRTALLARLDDDIEYVRQAAVRALAGLVGSEPEARAALLARLEDDAWGVRQAAVSALAESKEVLASAGGLRLRLAEWLLADVDERYLGRVYEQETRTRLATALGIHLPADPALRERVLAALADVRWSARLGATMALVHWPGGPPRETVQRILAALDDCRGLESYPARLTAASYLINRDPYSKSAIEVCLQALDYGTQPWEFLPQSGQVRQEAAAILGRLEPLRYDARIYEKLRHVMYHDQDAEVRDAVYGALVRLVGARETADPAAAYSSPD